MKRYCVLFFLIALQVVVDCRPVESASSQDSDNPAAPHVRQRRSTHVVLGDLPPPTTTGRLNEEHVVPFDCRCIYDADTTAETGIYTIDLGDGDGQFSVYCDMGLDPASSGDRGWTIIQRRLNDSLSFEKKWKSYRNGFGNMYGNFWLGLEKIRRMTNPATGTASTYELYVGLGDHYATQTTKYARYGSFSVNTELNDYKLSVGSYDAGSTAGDSMAVHDDDPFSTKDEDNDGSSVDCADKFKGGWWYNANCHDANLNGKWYSGGTLADPTVADGIIWQHWTGDQYSLKTVIMAIRPVSSNVCA